MPRRSTRLVPRQPVARSRVTNGTDVLPGIDQRSTIARRYRDICSAIASDQGGAERLSEARHQLIRRFAAAAVLAEQIEARMAVGENIDIGQHAMLSSTMTRIARRIGIDRRAHAIVPDLKDYIEERAIPEEPEEPEEPEPERNIVRRLEQCIVPTINSHVIR